MKYKTLKSVAHNYGDSFVGGFNWDSKGISIMHHLGNAVLQTGQRVLTVDLLAGKAQPKELMPTPVSQLVHKYITGFPAFLKKHSVPKEVVTSAKLTVSFFLSRALTHPKSRQVEIPYSCEVELTDDLKKVHVGKVREKISIAIAPHPIVEKVRKLFGRAGASG